MSNMIEHVKNSVFKALNNDSKLDSSITQIEGFTSLNIKHLLNNICSLKGANYLEVGVHKGATFVAANYKNNLNSSIAVDNWSEFDEKGQSKKTFDYNVKTFLPDGSYNVLYLDFFSLEKGQLSSPINIFFYDGHHSSDAQYKALSHIYDSLDDVFIFMVDDWNWSEVGIATRKSIEDLNLEVLYEREFVGELNNGQLNREFGWWNGFYISVLKKCNKRLSEE